MEAPVLQLRRHAAELMDWKRIGRIQLEDIRDNAIRRFFGLIVCALLVLVIGGTCYWILGVQESKNGGRRVNVGLGLAGIAVLWTYRVWSRKKVLDRKARTRPRRQATAVRPTPQLKLTDCEPPDAEDWASGRIEFSSVVDLTERWLWTIISFVVAGLLGYAMFSIPTTTEDTSLLYRISMAGLLAVIPMGCLTWAIAGLIRCRKTGVSSFQMDPVPALLGEQVCGVIELPAGLPLKKGLEIELVCVRQNSEGDCAVERTLRQKEKPAIRNDATLRSRLAIPISIHIPPDCLPTSRDESDERIRWVLVVKAAHSGYQAEFEVPIFKGEREFPPPRLDKMK